MRTFGRTDVQPVIQVRDLTMAYGDVDVLRGVDLDIHRGEVFALLRPNRAGKTTTVEILEGFRQRSGGEVSVLAVTTVMITVAVPMPPSTLAASLTSDDPAAYRELQLPCQKDATGVPKRLSSGTMPRPGPCGRLIWPPSIRIPFSGS